MMSKSRRFGCVVVALCHWALGACGGDSTGEPDSAGMGAGTSPRSETGGTGAGGTGSGGQPPDGPKPDAGPATTPGKGPPCRPPNGPKLSELSAEKIYTGSDLFDLRVVGDKLFVSDKNTIHRVPLRGGQSEQVVLPGPANIGMIL